MRQKMKRLMGILLSLVLMLGLMPGMSLTALAYDGNPYASLVGTTNSVTFNGKPWYIIADNSTAVDAGTVTLLAADTSFGLSEFSDRNSNNYSSSKVKASLDDLTTSGSFKDVADAIETNTDAGGKLYLLSTSEAQQLSPDVLKMNFSSQKKGSCWWLRSPGEYQMAAFVYGENGSVSTYGETVSYEFGVRPALKLNLSSVIFSSESKTFSLKPSHEHNFTYSASGATITATCSAESCDLTDNKTMLTITAPTMTTYGGTGDATATLTGLDAFNTATGKSIAATEIKYVGRDGTTYAESTTAPTDAGKYTAKITVEDKTASVDYEIVKADPNAPEPPVVEEITTNAISVTARTGEEYSIDGGKTWVKAKSGESVVTFDNLKPATTYAIVARMAGGEGKNPSPASEPTKVTTPVGQITSEIIIGDNLPNMKADGFDDALAKKLCTPEEIKSVDNGEHILYSLRITRLDNPPADDKALCEQEAANIGQNTAIDLYMDISIYKKVGDAEPVKVTNTGGNMINVSFDIPADLQAPANTQRAFYIIRVHDGKAEQIPATVEGGRISFQTDQFSTYALAHQDTVSPTPVNPVNPANSGTNAGTAAATGIQGNDNLTIALIIAGLALIIGVTAFVVRRRKDNQ